MAAWDTLSIAQRSQLMNIYRGYGITSLSDMRRMYNESHPQLETPNTPISPMYAGGGDKNGQITASRVTAKKPVDFIDFSPESQSTINDWALAVRQGTVKFNQVPSKYQTAVYQRMITQGTDKAAETITKVGLNTALALTDPVGYAAGWAAQKGIAYANDAASGRNEYDASDILGYTPVKGTQYAQEHPTHSILTDIAAGTVGGGVIRNIGNIVGNAEQVAQNAAAVSGLEREVLSYPSVVQPKTFGTVYKSGTKGVGKTGTVRSAKGSYGYTPNVSAKGVFSNQSSGSPAIISWSKPNAELPISPIPVSPGVPPVWWNSQEPKTVFIPQEEPVTIDTPRILSSKGNSRTPQEVINSLNQDKKLNSRNVYRIGGGKAKQVEPQKDTTEVYTREISEGDPEFVGPPTPYSVTVANHTRDVYNERAKKYEENYPNIAYFLRKSGDLRGQRLAANERAIMDFSPDNLIYIKGTKDHNVALLDSTALYGAKTKTSPIEALGLPAQETNFGFYPTAAWVGEEMRSFAKEIPEGYAANRQQVTPVEVLNNAAYANDPYGSSISYVAKKLHYDVPWDDSTSTFREDLSDEQLQQIEEALAKGRGYADSQAKNVRNSESVFKHAYELYNSGDYNSGDPNHKKDVRIAGEDAFTSPQIQQWWNTSGRKYYEQYAPELLNGFSSGGSIHIKPSRKGTFTAAATKHGMGVQEFASKVLANKDNYSPKMVKKAAFAKAASGWKHKHGGIKF